MLPENDILAFIFYSAEAAEITQLLRDYPIYAAEPIREAIRLAAAHWKEHESPPGDTISIYLREESKHHREIEKLLPRVKERWPYVEANLRVYKNEVGRSIEREIAERQAQTELQALEQDGSEGIEAYQREREKPLLSPFYSSPFLDLADTTAELFNTIDTTFSSGIEVFDRKKIIPQRGCYWLTLGLKGEGKTWRLIHFAKAALLVNQRVLFVTIEMGPAQIRKRILQSLFSLAADRQETHDVLRLHEYDEQGRAICACAPNTSYSLTRPGLGNADEDFHETRRSVTPVQLEVKRRLTGYDYYTLISVAPPKRFRIRGLEDKLKIVQHSPRTVTQNTIEQDLLKLKKEGFIPDIVIVDYLDDMKRDAGSDALFREAFRQCSEALKAVAVKYNCAVISATQSNQAGKGKDKLDSTNNSEAFAKMHGVDTFETITRSPINKKRGYAILYVENNRGGKDEITAGVSQCLAFGQFCIDSEEITDEVEAEQGRQAREAVNDLREVIIADLRLHPTDTTAMVAARHVNSRTSRHVSAEYVRGFLADRTLFTEEEARGHQGVPGRPTR